MNTAIQRMKTLTVNIPAPSPLAIIGAGRVTRSCRIDGELLKYDFCQPAEEMDSSYNPLKSGQVCAKIWDMTSTDIEGYKFIGIGCIHAIGGIPQGQPKSTDPYSPNRVFLCYFWTKI